jgi:hypothetical protein
MRLPRCRFQFVNLVLLIPAALCLVTLSKLDFLWLEALLLGACLLSAKFVTRRLGWTARPPVWCNPLRSLSRNAPLAYLLPGLLSAILRAMLLPWVPIPHPVVPDEYSHILLAKTFLLGRLANPPHPLWQHFESIHILSQPTYSSMYMAGQACFLALGKLLGGDLFWGVVLSTALFCSALTWFLRAYVPPGWAMLGGVLAAVRIGAASYWNDTYWGGSAGALGGALVLGAYPRLARTWRAGPAVAFAVGLALLANTRPYEGAVLGLVLTVALLWNLVRRRHDRPGRDASWKRVGGSIAVAALLLGISGWAMTRHWKAVTGNALTLPYQVNQRMYGWPMTLAWLPAPTITYRHPEFALYRDFEIREHQLATEPAQIPWGLLVKYSFLWRFFFGAGLSAAFLFTHKILAARRMRMVWIAGCVVLLAVVTEQSGYPHYLSPAAPAVFLFLIQGLRYAARWRAGQAPIGAAVVRCIIPILCVVLAVRAATMSPRSPPSAIPNYLSWCCVDARQRDREPILQKLEALPGNHLVIVSYDLKIYDTFEWVYNQPDIDHAKVVWARDMGPERNQELLRYYPGRRVWKVLIRNGEATLLGPGVEWHWAVLK